MPTPYDISPSVLIERLARDIKEGKLPPGIKDVNLDAIAPPSWASFVKTGPHTQRPPQNPDWWFTRCASLLRKIYVKGPIGLERLRSEYGGRIDRGARPEHVRKGGGAIIRKALQQLQAAGLVEPLRNRGRVVTREGRQMLERLSAEVKGNLEKTQPELGKY